MTKYDFLRFITIFSYFDTTTREYSKIAMALCIKAKRRLQKNFIKLWIKPRNTFQIDIRVVEICKITKLNIKGT